MHAHSGGSCYWPRDICCGEQLLAACLRPAHREAAAGSLEELPRVGLAFAPAYPSAVLCAQVLAHLRRELPGVASG